ncbi:MAG: hypothetical protein VX575_03465 [Pseudomonadota bacterium]|nr:hypothetical protein [Pseudomonadota bacterium]MEC7830430.1 hypothetical protein [Pseudomonadota bacterium]MEC9414755.1 hypothetical protein [Pseudomonadota bacterium]
MGISVCNTSQESNNKNLLDKKKEEQLKKDLNHFERKKLKRK